MPAPPPIELTRHYHELSETETDEVVEAVADLIVNFLKGSADPKRSGERNHDRHVAQQAESR